MPDNLTAEKRRIAEAAERLGAELQIYTASVEGGWLIPSDREIVESALDAYAALVCAEKDARIAVLLNVETDLKRQLSEQDAEIARLREAIIHCKTCDASLGTCCIEALCEAIPDEPDAALSGGAHE